MAIHVTEIMICGQSDQSPRCPHEETLDPWLSKLCSVKLNVFTWRTQY